MSDILALPPVKHSTLNSDLFAVDITLSLVHLPYSFISSLSGVIGRGLIVRQEAHGLLNGFL